jgi:hypothetical protein
MQRYRAETTSGSLTVLTLSGCFSPGYFRGTIAVPQSASCFPFWANRDTSFRTTLTSTPPAPISNLTARAIDLPIPEAADTQAYLPFKGNSEQQRCRSLSFVDVH